MTANLATSTHRNTHTTALNAHSRGERKDPPAQNPQVWADHILVADNNDDNALDRLVKEYQSYALSLAARLHRGHEPREDLNQIALEGLVLALKRFEPARGISVSGLCYAHNFGRNTSLLPRSRLADASATQCA